MNFGYGTKEDPWKLFPVTDGNGQRLGYVDWAMAQKAYEVQAWVLGSDKSLEQLHDEGGFSLEHLTSLLCGELLSKAIAYGFKPSA